MPAALTLQASAKINLYLHVTGKRPDGYHLLDSLTAFPRDIYDEVTLAPAKRFSFTTEGPFAQNLEVDDSNLVVKAAQAMAQATGNALDISIHLKKNIPLGSGLGGGSADAAATVRGLEKFWDVSMDESRKQDLLLSLGADVPVCYQNLPCRFRGIGENITPSSLLPPLHVLLVWPGKPSFTKDIFTHFNRPFAAPLPEKLPPLQDTKSFLEFLKTTENSLQESAEYLCPEIADAQDFMEAQEGCLFARMTGSGATVFGLFESEKLCLTAKSQTKPGWWCQSSPL